MKYAPKYFSMLFCSETSVIYSLPKSVYFLNIWEANNSNRVGRKYKLCRLNSSLKAEKIPSQKLIKEIEANLS